jgi:hypothetical protein
MSEFFGVCTSRLIEYSLASWLGRKFCSICLGGRVDLKHGVPSRPNCLYSERKKLVAYAVNVTTANRLSLTENNKRAAATGCSLSVLIKGLVRVATPDQDLLTGFRQFCENTALLKP